MSTKKLDVKINQGIISVLGKKLYSSEYWMVILRELIQNSLDANCKRLDVTWNNGTLIVKDDGIGIAQIEGLLDTIGGTLKLENIDNIGGYGLAKLAIFSAKYWKFLSISGSFSTGFIFDESEKIEHGTIVECQFNESEYRYDSESYIKAYLSLIDRKVDIFYNEEKIEHVEFKDEFFNGNCEKLVTNPSYWNGKAIIRVNGLVTFTRWISNLNGMIIFDYHVNLNPYDDGYPLTSNRDDFINGTTEKIDLESRIKTIESKLEVDKKLSENVEIKHDSMMKWRNKSYLTEGNVTIQDFNEYAMEISTYERYLRQIDIVYYGRSKFDTIDVDFTIGLANTNKFEACNNGNIFYLTIGHKTKGQLLSLAIHEFTHYLGYGQCGHDQEFATKMTRLLGMVAESILDGTFRK